MSEVIANREISKILDQTIHNNILDSIGNPNGILIYIEYHHGIIHPVSYQLIGKAYELSQNKNIPIYGVVIGAEVHKAESQLLHTPLDTVYLYESDEYMKSDLYEHLLSDCIQKLKPSIVLVGGTKEGRTLAPLSAAAFKTGLTADCTELLLDEDGSLIQIRPAFGGDIMARIITPVSRPQFATVRYGIMDGIQKNFPAQTLFIQQRAEKEISSKIELLDIKELKKERGIESEQILIAGGKGIQKKQDMDMLRELASLLGGKVAGSRALIEKGFLPPEMQIGLSGKTVCPKLLITCGISGSIQFLTGMRRSSCIVSINTDEKAKIFRFAHYPVLGDLYEVIPHLIERIKNFA